MNRALGSKDGKNNRRLFRLNKKRKKKIDELEIIQKEVIDDNNLKRKKEQLIISHVLEKETNNFEKMSIEDNKEKKESNDKLIQDIEDEIIINKPTLLNVKRKPKGKNEEKRIIKDDKQKNDIVELKKEEKLENNIELSENEIKKEIKDVDYLEKQIIKILEQQIDENNFKLKKLDSDMHVIQKEIDDLNEKEDVAETLKEIELLIERLKQIKRQIISLQQTFEFDFPIDEPDNYLIYLVDEYKEKSKIDKELGEKLKQHDDYKNIVDRIIEIEEKQEELLERIDDKKKSLELDNEKLERITNDVVDIDDMKKKIEQMLTTQNKLLEDIKIKVNETVHITERVDYITRTVKHSILDLFLLMGILKHNLSIKNNVIAAVSAKVALDLIIKMTTPTEEKIITKVNDVKDYNNLIDDCLKDTGKLIKLVDENLNSISSIRFTFENDYKEYSYLPNYQEVLDKIITLEDEIKERKIEVIKIKKETELQLEKNNAKVKKYSSMAA